MSSLSIFQIAGSALSAQSQRMNVTASNLANADSVADPDGQPYQARQVVFQLAPAPGKAYAQSVGGGSVAAGVASAAPHDRKCGGSGKSGSAGGNHGWWRI